MNSLHYTHTCICVNCNRIISYTVSILVLVGSPLYVTCTFFDTKLLNKTITCNLSRTFKSQTAIIRFNRVEIENTL